VGLAAERQDCPGAGVESGAKREHSAELDLQSQRKKVGNGA